MAYPVAAGGVDFNATGMIPPTYPKKLLVEFYGRTLFGTIASTELQGQIQTMGDTVRVRTLPDVTINTFVEKTDLDYEDPEPGYVELLIDKGKYWGIRLEDLNKIQTDIKTYGAQWADHATAKMAIEVDKDVLGGVYSSADAANAGLTAGKLSVGINLGVTGTPLALTKTNILDFIVDLETVFDEQDVPNDQRKLVFPAWAIALIEKSDWKDASMTGMESAMKNGRLGMIGGFEIFKSNNLTVTTDTYKCAEVIACHPTAIAFAAQIPTTGKYRLETLRDTRRFGDLMRGMTVYGYKVVKPEALIHAHVYKG